jgi:hypothetical protein
MEITADDFESVCTGGAGDTALCALHDDSVADEEKGGLLLLGSGRLYRASGLFLAYISNTEFGEVNVDGEPLVWYWSDPGWSREEKNATPLVTAGGDACQHGTNSLACLTLLNDTERRNVFGEVSAKLIRSSSEESVIVLLSNHVLDDDELENVWYRTARLSTPWLVSAPTMTETSGYGPYIIDAYIEHDGLSGDIGLYHTISIWGEGPYGVYTGYEEVAWPLP